MTSKQQCAGRRSSLIDKERSVVADVWQCIMYIFFIGHIFLSRQLKQIKLAICIKIVSNSHVK